VSVAVSHGFGHPMDTFTPDETKTIRQSLVVTKLLFYLSVGFASMSVVEFIVKLKGPQRIWLVDYALRLVTPVWGFAGVIQCVVILALGSAEVPVRNKLPL
jgi:hypothetical protein